MAQGVAADLCSTAWELFFFLQTPVHQNQKYAGEETTSGETQIWKCLSALRWKCQPKGEPEIHPKIPEVTAFTTKSERYV